MPAKLEVVLMSGPFAARKVCCPPCCSPEPEPPRLVLLLNSIGSYTLFGHRIGDLCRPFPVPSHLIPCPLMFSRSCFVPSILLEAHQVGPVLAELGSLQGLGQQVSRVVVSGDVAHTSNP